MVGLMPVGHVPEVDIEGEVYNYFWGDQIKIRNFIWHFFNLLYFANFSKQIFYGHFFHFFDSLEPSTKLIICIFFLSIKYQFISN